MLNLVTETEGVAGAVLVRAIEPIVGIDIMAERRGGRRGVEMTNGPGKVAQALGIGLEDNGTPLGESLVVYDAGADPSCIQCGGRIGLSAGHELPLRYWVAGSEYVSKGRPGPRPRKRRGESRKEPE